jgi:hypothetical protein
MWRRWRRLAARCARKEFADRFRESLAPHQFGVAVPGGTEILVHAARFLFEGSVSKSDFYVLKFDFKNAFNCVSRAGVLRSGCGAFPQPVPLRVVVLRVPFSAVVRREGVVELLWRAAG